MLILKQSIPIDKFRQEVLKIYNFQKDCLLTEIDLVCFQCFPVANNEISNMLSTEITSTFNSTYSLRAFTGDNVWKLSLCSMGCVHILTALCHEKQEYLSQTSLPSQTHVKSGFLCFSKLHGPANLDACQDSLQPFSVSVYEAIEELHQFGFAHLDIILPNISFKQQGSNKWIAVLIDLDTFRRSSANEW